LRGSDLLQQFPYALNQQDLSLLFEKNSKLFAQHDFSSLIHSCLRPGKATWTIARLLLLSSLRVCNGLHVLNRVTTATRRNTIARQHNIYFGFLVVSLMNSFRIYYCPYTIIGFIFIINGRTICLFILLKWQFMICHFLSAQYRMDCTFD